MVDFEAQVKGLVARSLQTLRGADGAPSDERLGAHAAAVLDDEGLEELAEEPSTVAPEPTVQVVLEGQRMDIRKPAADYLEELEHEVRELSRSQREFDEIVPISLQGEAAIADALEFEASVCGPQEQEGAGSQSERGRSDVAERAA